MQLPPSNISKKGFTLIELMVVLAILAILAVVGFAMFTGQQRAARNSRRHTDIESIANAMENNKVLGAADYTLLSNSMFVNGAVPTDSGFGVAQYCATPAQVQTMNVTGLTTTGVTCGFLGPGTWTLIGPGNPGNVPIWTICAQLEGSVPEAFCRSSIQS